MEGFVKKILEIFVDKEVAVLRGKVLDGSMLEVLGGVVGLEVVVEEEQSGVFR